MADTTNQITDNGLDGWSEWKEAQVIEAGSAFAHVKTHAQMAAFALLMSVWSAAADSKETHNYTPAVVTESGESCETPNPALAWEELKDCFGKDFLWVEDEALQWHVARVWGTYNQDQKNRAVALFWGWLTAMQAIATVTDNDDRTETLIRIIHANAIEIGHQEFVVNMAKDPELEGLEDADFQAYGDELMGAFLDGTDNSTLGEFVKYAPLFTEYVLEASQHPDHIGDFDFAEDLARVVNIDNLNVRQAEQERIRADAQNNIDSLNTRQAEQEWIRAAYLKLQSAFQWDV